MISWGRPTAEQQPKTPREDRGFAGYVEGMVNSPDGIQLIGKLGSYLFAPLFRMPLWGALDRFLAKSHHRFQCASIAVGASAVLLVERDPTRIQVWLWNNGIATVYVGGSRQVTTGGAPAGIATTQANQQGSAAAGAITLTVPAQAGITNQVTSFTVTGTGATASSIISITLAGVQGGTQTYLYVVPAGAAAAAPTLEVTFPTPLLASGPNVAIVLTVPSFGAGNLGAAAELEAQAVTPAQAGTTGDPNAGWPLPAGQSIIIDKVAAELWAISTVAAQDVRVVDLAG